MKSGSNVIGPAIRAVLACPTCKGELVFEPPASEAWAECSACGSRYPCEDGVARMIPGTPPETLREKWVLWESVQKNGAYTYEAAPELNLAATGRNHGEAFREFLDIAGATLDIGCGPQEVKPIYAGGVRVDDYVGLDPLMGRQPRQFEFVQGIAEALPFKAARFEHVIFSSSLDHLMDYRLALEECRRVLVPGGQIHLYLSLFEGDSGKPGTLRRWLDIARRGVRQAAHGFWSMGPARTLRYLRVMARMKIPEGALDFFHLHFPTREELKATFTELGFAIEREKQLGNVVFVSAKANATVPRFQG